MRHLLGQALGMMADLGPTMSKIARGGFDNMPMPQSKRQKKREERRWKKIRRKQGRH